MKGSEQTLITACHFAGNNRKSQFCPEDEEAAVFFLHTQRILHLLANPMNRSKGL